jgi:putative chitinase
VTNAPADQPFKSADEWMGILFALEVREQTARYWAPAFSELVRADAFSMGWEEIDDFVAQIVFESGHLEKVVENLNYRVERLSKVWPRRFTNLEYAKQFANNPVALGNRVYGGRMGNDQPGDGFRYRGRSPLMITGKDAYEMLQAEIDEPLVDKPELLETPRVGLKASIAWWEKRIPDSIVNNPALVSRRVNGGDNGLIERVALSRLADQLV